MLARLMAAGAHHLLEYRMLASGVLNGEELPLVGHALEVVPPAVREGDPRAEDQHLNGARDEHLAGLGQGGEPRADVDRQADRLCSPALDFPGVQSGPDLEVDLPDRVADRARAPDGPGRPGQCSERAERGFVGWPEPGDVVAEPADPVQRELERAEAGEQAAETGQFPWADPGWGRNG
jgi:hypothetical protein